MRLLLSGLLGVSLAYAAVLGSLYTFQRKLLYRPEADLPTPEAIGLHGVEVVRFAAEDGNPLLAWYAPPRSPDGFVVLYLHGNAGHIGYRAHRLHWMTQQGWGVFLPEYRGFGGNPGTPTEAGLRLDAQAALATVEDLGIPPERILLWGESLGTNLAIRLAARANVAAVLLESPYTSIAATAQVHYPYVPARAMIKDRFDSLALAGRMRAPVLVMQGARDRIVPPAMGRAVLAAVTAPSELWVAEEAGHNDLAQAGAIEAAADFVRRRVPLPDRHMAAR